MRQPELTLAGRTLGIEAARRRRVEARQIGLRVDVRAVVSACLEAEPLWPAGRRDPTVRQQFAVTCEVRNLLKQLVSKGQNA
ncbi:MAG TPA: hypothetical protein VI911_00330 [Patescibacteria group bacterium]|nr:hypothetical protein [Patescibacteria group bacterium]